MGPHQKLTPGLVDKLCFTATATGSYEEAALVAERWMQRTVNAATLYKLVQRLGARAEQQTQERLESLPPPKPAQRGAGELAVVMVDGWMVRQRGPGWGLKQTRENRVEWHELKTGVFYLQEQSAQTQGGRGLLADKVIVSWQGEPLELGRRLNGEALPGRFGASQEPFVCGRWRSVGLEPATRPVGQRHRPVGFLSCQRAPVACVARR